MMRYWFVLALAGAAGCGKSTGEPPVSNTPATEASRQFDPASTGTIKGHVRWAGAIPVVEPLRVLPSSLGMEALRKRTRDNPNAPRIDPEHQGIASAIIFLRGVEPSRSRPWNHAAVTVEMKDYGFLVRQGDGSGPYGFVRRGEAITMVARQKAPHGLRADGAAFFTLPFLDPDMPLTRRLEKSGVVELTSSTAYFWMRAHLFVDDHPYYTATAADRSFTLTEVPAGTYDLVCWMPNWHEAGRDLDPESGIVLRQRFAPPVQLVEKVQVEAGNCSAVEFRLTGEMFQK